MLKASPYQAYEFSMIGSMFASSGTTEMAIGYSAVCRCALCARMSAMASV
jgi:hypothetical protein